MQNKKYIVEKKLLREREREIMIVQKYLEENKIKFEYNKTQ